MPYVATALARSGDSWSGREIDLGDLDDLDAVVDALRDAANDDNPVLLLVEENDEWFGVVRVDGDAEPRLFLSDARMLEQSEVAFQLFQDASLRSMGEEPEDEQALRAEGDPAGDLELLADLGTPASELGLLVGRKGMLPSDVLAAICEQAGCLEPLEELRGA